MKIHAFSTNRGSFDGLNVSLRCGCRANARHILPTCWGSSPTVRPEIACSSVLHSCGVDSSAGVSARSTSSSLILRGVPGRDSEDFRNFRYDSTTVNGKSRDLLLDGKGSVVETEDEVDIDSIPAAARNAIPKLAAGGFVQKVETVTIGSSVSYEAAIKAKTGKSIAVSVNADGSPHKD